MADCVKVALLRSQHGEEKIANDASGYYLAGHFTRTYDKTKPRVSTYRLS